jgi:hypothetical protein
LNHVNQVERYVHPYYMALFREASQLDERRRLLGLGHLCHCLEPIKDNMARCHQRIQAICPTLTPDQCDELYYLVIPILCQ